MYAPEDSSALFSEMIGVFGPEVLHLKYIDASKINTSKVVNMSFMFASNSYSHLSQLDVSKFNTSNVKDMSGLFYGLNNISNLDINHFNTNKVLNMSNMFKYTEKLENLNVSKWDTSNVTNMSNMFDESGIIRLEGVNNWDTHNVTNLSYMFNYATRLIDLDLNNWNTNKVTSLDYTFYSMDNLRSLNIQSWNTDDVETAENMFFFYNSKKLKHFAFGNKFTLIKNIDNLLLPLKPHDYGDLYTEKWKREDNTLGAYTVEELTKEYRTNPDKIAGVWVREKSFNGYDLIFETGTFENFNPIKVEVGTNIDLPTPTILKPNHSFIGWSKTLNGELIKDTTNLGQKNETVTLYAKWNKIQNEDSANLKPIHPKDDESEINIHNNNKLSIIPPTVEKPEYTGTLSTNTPVDDNGELILPPTYNKEEYTKPISTNTPIDNDENLILPPVVDILEYKNTVVNDLQKDNEEKVKQSVTDKPISNNSDSVYNHQEVEKTNAIPIDKVEKKSENEQVVQKQNLPKTNTLNSITYILELLLSTIGFKRNKQE